MHLPKVSAFRLNQPDLLSLDWLVRDYRRATGDECSRTAMIQFLIRWAHRMQANPPSTIPDFFGKVIACAGCGNEFGLQLDDKLSLLLCKSCILESVKIAEFLTPNMKDE